MVIAAGSGLLVMRQYQETTAAEATGAAEEIAGSGEENAGDATGQGSGEAQTAQNEGRSSPTASPSAPGQDASQALSDLRQRTLAGSSRALNGSWVVQLSSKKVGMQAEGRTWTEESILESFEGYQRRHPDAALLWSGDWSTYLNPDYWVVIIDEPYASPGPALAFCAAEGYSRDDCIAKKLSDTDGPDGTTEFRD